MLRFDSDYMEGAHPAILQKLTEINYEKNSGYGTDPYCAAAAEKIKEACNCPDAVVSFLVGGTQTNMIVISTMLKDWEGVIAADSGHVSVHESGAIEYTGHKVIELPSVEGKLTAEWRKNHPVEKKKKKREKKEGENGEDGTGNQTIS